MNKSKKYLTESFKLSVYYFVILFVLVLSGCPSNVVNNDNLVGEPLAIATTLVGEAQQNVRTATPLAGEAAKPNLLAADTQLTSTTEQLRKAKTELTQLRHDFGIMQDENIRQDQIIKAYKTRWFGDKLVSSLKWLIAGWVVLGIGSALLNSLTGGFFGAIGGIVLHALPLANPWVALSKRVGNK